MKNSKDHLYFIQSDVTGAIKIGRSNDPDRRIKDLQTGNPYKIKLIQVLENKGHLEKALHKELKKFKIQLEWFDYMCLGSIPQVIYEQIEDPTKFDDWWEK
jgi:hypothetical protein